MVGMSGQSKRLRYLFSYIFKDRVKVSCHRTKHDCTKMRLRATQNVEKSNYRTRTCQHRFFGTTNPLQYSSPHAKIRGAQRLWKTQDHVTPNYPQKSTNKCAVQSVWAHAVDDTTDTFHNVEATSFDTSPLTEDCDECSLSFPNMPQMPSRQKPSLADLLARIAKQEKEGGRMKSRQLGVLTEDPAEDMRQLMHNYTVPALASALRDREEVLQYCAQLMANNDYTKLAQVLKPFEAHYVRMRRFKNRHLDLSRGYDLPSLEMLRKGLSRISRQITQAHQKRAGVVLPLCNVNGVACVLFEKRSRHLRAHADEVCLPGGMVSVGDDKSITATCLREMEEEIGIRQGQVTVLGILRCNWGEVVQLTGVAVTPVVCFVGELGEKDYFEEGFQKQINISSSSSSDAQKEIDMVPGTKLTLNPQEVAECFTVPLAFFLDKSRWIHRDDAAPIFTGGPYLIWGLTGYILDRFVKDVLARYTVTAQSDVT